MSREFKFRVWNKNWQKWSTFQSLYGIRTNGRFVTTEFSIDENFVIQQFTGCHDKNGKEIYEGDICNGVCNLESYYGLEVNKGIIEFKYYGFFCDHDWLVYFNNGAENVWIEVIGNIFQNPELLIMENKDEV